MWKKLNMKICENLCQHGYVSFALILLGEVKYSLLLKNEYIYIWRILSLWWIKIIKSSNCGNFGNDPKILLKLETCFFFSFQHANLAMVF